MEVQEHLILCFGCDADISALRRKIRLRQQHPVCNRLLADKRKEYEPNRHICGTCYDIYRRQAGEEVVPPQEVVEDNGIIPVYYTTKQQRSCLVCSSKEHRNRITKRMIASAFLDKRIVIRKDSRSCPIQFRNANEFTQEALDQLLGSAKRHIVSENTFDDLMREAVSTERQAKGTLSFDEVPNPNSLLYTRYLGLTPEDFASLVEIVGPEMLCQRGLVRRNIAIFLIKLRTNMSQIDIGILFDIKQPDVSIIIDDVCTTLTHHFVPKYLGFDHITRIDYKVNHGSILSDTLFDVDSDQVVGILDGTYLYIEKSCNHSVQKRSYSLHKHRNLVKPMVTCAPDGYILDSDGVFWADGDNNDASIFSAMCTNSSGLLSFFKKGDVLLVDRGFRDVLTLCNNVGLRACMPSYLHKSKSQHTALEGNESRFVTKCRWAIESVNGRIKNQFSFFGDTIRNSYLPKLNKFFNIACALLNAYSPPLASDKEEHIRMAEQMLALKTSSNDLMQIVQSNQYEKRKRGARRVTVGNTNDFDDFPRLTPDDLAAITLGSYQVKHAASYTVKNINDAGNVELYYHFEQPDIVRFDICSRFKSKTHRLWIRFEPQHHENQAALAIKGWYCLCRSGARTVGTCSHVASLIWYFGYGRHLASLPNPGASVAVSIKDAATIIYDSDTE